MSRFLSFAAFNLSTLGNRRSGTEKAALDASYPEPSLRGHYHQTVKPYTAGARRQDRAGQLSGKAPLAGQEAPRVGSNLGRGKQRSERLTPSHLRGARRDLLAGDQRFSEGLAGRRDADLFLSHNLYYRTFKAQLFDQHKQTRTANASAAQRPGSGAFWSAGAAVLAGISDSGLTNTHDVVTGTARPW
jgi:hypothetical protein